MLIIIGGGRSTLVAEAGGSRPFILTWNFYRFLNKTKPVERSQQAADNLEFDILASVR
ncbi:hypothetical protein [Mesobacillus harenae]|uniref:hypothetical protein n=1 Tax=Mesobacillus harenae TaxID=2213203 RepID=UPI0015806A43|nr:hypothetical protein [Mesobacillus harenae]